MPSTPPSVYQSVFVSTGIKYSQMSPRSASWSSTASTRPPCRGGATGGTAPAPEDASLVAIGHLRIAAAPAPETAAPGSGGAEPDPLSVPRLSRFAPGGIGAAPIALSDL